MEENNQCATKADDASPPMMTEAMSHSQMHGLLAAGRAPTSPSRQRWSPPSVEDLQQALPQYEISAFIACGGMGAVYRGMQKALKRPVAIKVLPPEIDDGEAHYSLRFKHEAQAMARLSHPNIVGVFDAGETADGLLYFVMEFIEGTDVAQLIASEGHVEPGLAIRIISSVCDALAFAHEEGIIHRDIKPSNVMIDKRGRVKVADFGLAKIVHADATLVTQSHMALGTPDFIAPETLIPGMAVDPRADLYAVGVMLYQMLTGRLPRGRFEPPSGVVPQVGRSFDAIIDKALQTDRDKRYGTAQELKRDLEAAAGKDQGRLMPADTGGSTPRSWKRRMLVGGGVAVFGGTAAKILLAGRNTKPAPSTAVSPPPQSGASGHRAVWRPVKFNLDMNGENPATADRRMEDGALFLANYTGFRVPLNSANAALRATCVVHPKMSKQVLMLRWQKHPHVGDHHCLQIERGAIAIFVRESVPSPRLIVEQRWRLNRNRGDGEEMRVQFTCIGDKLLGSVDGVFIGGLKYSHPPVSGDAGFGASHGSFKNAEVLDLTGLSEIEALNAAGLDPAVLKQME